MTPSDAQARDMALEIDHRARQEALDVRRSMLLQAPAGSGKTTVLTARFLALLAAADAPEEILAITFTRKAAAEMRHRVLAALQAASAGQAVAGIATAVLQAAHARDAARGWNLKQNPSRLRIETIDALNHWLATQLPIASRSGPRLEIASAPAPLYRRAARACLQLAAEDRDAAAAAELLFDRLDNSWRRLEQLLADMLERRSHWLPRLLQARGSGLAQRVQDSLESALRAELAPAIATLPTELLREGEALLTHVQRVRAAAAAAAGAPHAAAAGAVLLDAEPASLPHWRAVCELAMTEHGWRRRFTTREGFERNDKAMKMRVGAWIDALERLPDAQRVCRVVRALPDPWIDAADQQALEALSVLLVRAAAELQLVFAASARVDYSYVAAAAREALSEQGAPSDFALRAGAALRHILVDEFQDTSYEQFALLRALTAGWEPGDARTLFVVGDPMQSIYRFREAEVGLFLQARDHGVGDIRLQPLQLRRNFRSSAGLVDWVNAQFSRLFPPDDDTRRAAIRYLASVPAAAAVREAGAATLHRLHDGDLATEAERVVEIVRAARARDASTSIAVLVVSREHAALSVARLRAAGFSLRGVDLERLRDRPVIRDLAALTRALLHAGDRTAWLALLRAPWCALTLAELEALGADAGADMFELLRAAASSGSELAPAPQLRSRLSRLYGALAPAIHGVERGLPLWQRVEHCWLRLAAPAIHRAEADRLDAQRFIDALVLHDDPQRLVGEALGELTERLYSGSPPHPGAIEVMTVHAAKGLEWDLVILPGLGRSTAVDTDPLLHWIELPGAGADTELLLAPIRASPQEPRCSLAGYIKSLQRERARLERVRLLYVAATRARSELHLLAALPLPANPDKPPLPRAGSLLKIMWPAIGQQFLALTPVAGAPVPAALAAQPRLWRLPQTWTMPSAPAPPAVQRLRLASPTPEEAPEYRWVGSTARAVGTIVHAELHRLAAAAQARSQPALLPPPAALSDYGAWLSELGVAQQEQAAAGGLVREAIARTLADARGRWLLSNSHREARSEWRLSGLHHGRVVNVVIDRMLVDQQGQRWVVDFKTSVHQGGSQRDFIDSEAERYRAQLLRYASLVRELGPEPVRLALYFPLLGVFRELDAPTA